jgi:hypothetical protein
MEKYRRIDGYRFEYDTDNDMYECRGAVCYDDYHDEVPEEGLWVAGCKLEKKLIEEGHNAQVEQSEKGWVEVAILK